MKNKKGEGRVPFTLLWQEISPAYFKQPKLLPENALLNDLVKVGKVLF